MKKNKTVNERQAALRARRKEWLKAHGFNSAEGLIGKLMKGEVVLVKNKVAV